MVIRRSDSRRRRVGVLIDESSAASDGVDDSDVSQVKTVSRKKAVVTPANAYALSAKRRHLAKTTDLIPKRVLSFALVVLSLVAAVAMLNWLYLSATQLTQVLGNRAIEVFSLTQYGSISQWFTTLLLIVSGMASLQIYALRQHRSNDYRGTYRLWFWLSLLLLFASLDSAVGLHDLFLNAIGYFTNRPITHGGWALVTFKLFALTLLVGRGLIEVRQSKGAVVAVLFVWVAYAGSIVMQLPQVKSGIVSDFEAYYGNSILFGTVALLLAIFTYARFVYLGAQGLLVVKTESAKKSKKRQTKSVASTTKKKTTKTKTSSKKTTRKATTAPAAEEAQEATEVEVSTAKVTAKKKRAKTSKRQPGTTPKTSVRMKSNQSNGNDAKEVTAESESNSSADQPTIASLPLGGKLSKSQQRKLRKQQKQARRRAA